MLKVLLIDDEPYILTGLSKLIDWGQYGFEIVGLCCRASEALLKAKETQPHVIITDIEMPGMSGLDLMDRLKDVLPETKIVILSAYDRFEYAQKAIRLGAYQYLLKPIDQEKLIALLLELKEYFEKKLQSDTLLHQLANDTLSQNQLISSYLIKDVVSGEVSVWNDNQKALYQSLEQGFVFQLVFVAFDHEWNRDGSYSPLFPASVEEDFKKVIDRIQPITYFSKEQIMVLVCAPDKMENKFEFDTENTVTIGISLKKKGFFGVRAFFEKQLLAFQQNLFFSKKGQMILLEAVSFQPDDECTGLLIALFEKHRRPLVHSISSFDHGALEENLKYIFSLIDRECRQVRFTLIQSFFENLTKSVAKDICEGAGKEETEKTRPACPLPMNRIFTLADIQSCLRLYFKELMAVALSSGAGCKNLIYKVQEYVKTHYQESDLKLGVIADRYFVNYSYLSFVFKKETGVNFYKYLLEIRLNEAKRLLASTGLSIAQIAVLVGYQDSKNFHHVFKKTIGISPNKFRLNG